MIEFNITQHQYDIILRQALENLPYECGGFLGGKENKILGVLPTINKNYNNSTDFFIIDSDDILRAHEFFNKHNLQYLGVYHTHPHGLPEPSEQDLKNIQKFLFIIGLKNPSNPEFNAFETLSGKAYPIPIKVVDNKGYTILDLHSGQQKMSEGAMEVEMNRLQIMINDIRNERAQYPRMNPVDLFGNSM